MGASLQSILLAARALLSERSFYVLFGHFSFLSSVHVAGLQSRYMPQTMSLVTSCPAQLSSVTLRHDMQKACTLPTLGFEQVYDRKTRIKPQKRPIEDFHGIFTYWDVHDFAALLVAALSVVYGSFWAGVR